MNIEYTPMNATPPGDEKGGLIFAAVLVVVSVALLTWLAVSDIAGHREAERIEVQR